MDPFETASSLYAAAYHAYQEVAERIARKLATGGVLSAKEVEEEGKALEKLAAAQRELLDAMAPLARPRG